MKKRKLIIFDLDGTLVDAYPAIIGSFNYVMRQLGLRKHSDAVIRKAVGWGDKNLLQPFVPAGMLDRALMLYRNHHSKAIFSGSRLFTATLTLLKLLKKRGCALAIASNRPTKFTVSLLKHLRLEKYFDYVLCADKLRQGKPHPEIIFKIMKKLKIGASDTIYVGDMTIDAQAGRCAGVRTFIVTTGSSSRKQIEMQKPDMIFKNLQGLISVLKKGVLS